jgi:hypothetical protein
LPFENLLCALRTAKRFAPRENVCTKQNAKIEESIRLNVKLEDSPDNLVRTAVMI